MTTQITQSQARSPGPGLIKTLAQAERLRDTVHVYSAGGPVRNKLQDYETRIVSEKY